ncbi:MAG TPA: HEAT repeat domain-containing protein [Vicinamibacterales bacterium]
MTTIVMAATLLLPPAAWGVDVPAAWAPTQRAEARDRANDAAALYQRGTEALDRGEFDLAAESFAAAAKLQGDRADGALYWQAYALNKGGRRAAALDTLASLRQRYPSSRWLREARALEIEIRQASGQTPPAENAPDDDLKLMALNGLMQADPDRALPRVEAMLAEGSGKVRDRALFVLAQSGSPKAREALVRFARSAQDEDLQVRAVRYLGLFGGQESRQALVDLYGSSASERTRKAVLQAFMLAGDRQRLLQVARTESSPALRREAIQLLGVSGGRAEIRELYDNERSPEVREAAINAMFVGGDSERLAQLARTESDPRLRRDAIVKLGLTGRGSADTLTAIYAGEQDVDVKRSVLQALFVQGNAAALVDIARKEQDPKLKREAVQKLSLMDAKEARDYMLELLK